MNSPARSTSQVDSANYFLLGLDRMVDFATLGEYRVVFGDAGTDQAVRSVSASTNSDRKTVSDEEIWATDIEWSAADEWGTQSRSRGKCSLPRARDRKLARERVRG